MRTGLLDDVRSDGGGKTGPLGGSGGNRDASYHAGTGGTRPIPEAGTEDGPEVGTGIGRDTSPNDSRDVGQDGNRDVGIGDGIDLRADSRTDSKLDAAPDLEVDAKMDSSLDAARDLGADRLTDSSLDAARDLGADRLTDSSLDAARDLGADHWTDARDGGDTGTPTLKLVAGRLGGPGDQDGTGTSARFYYPVGVVSDGAGHLFVADSGNNTIRQIVIATGAVTTLAGSPGIYGSSNGTGAAARFLNPTAMAVDSAGNLFVADSGNHTIRQIVIATGVVTTLAGSAGTSGSSNGTGTAARFAGPTGLAVDGAGHLFVADSGNHTIRQIVIATGVVTTLAGSAGTSGSSDGTGTTAQFAGPSGMAVDSAGNLFVADKNNHTIRQIVINTGAVTTLAGTAGTSGSSDSTGTAAQFYQPSGLATDNTGNLFVSDTVNHTIRQIVIATGVVTTIAGSAGTSGSSDGTGTTARFNSPMSVACNGTSDLYIADRYNNTIRKVVIATGVVSTVAGA
jgi:hypothetical protein